MRCEGQEFYADCILVCLLFVQATEKFLIGLHTPNSIITKDCVGFLQHNMETLEKFKFLMSSLNAISRGDFYGAEPPW